MRGHLRRVPSLGVLTIRLSCRARLPWGSARFSAMCWL